MITAYNITPNIVSQTASKLSAVIQELEKLNADIQNGEINPSEAAKIYNRCSKKAKSIK